VLLAPVQAIVTVAIFRLAALIARGDPVALSDAVSGGRKYVREALVAGAVLTLLSVVFVANIAIGLATRQILGGVLAAFAGWGLFVMWTGALVFWPLLADPRREEMTLRERVRLVGLLVVAFPVRLGGLLLLVAAVLAVSTILFVALLTIAVSFVALLACRYVLPAADRFEGRATELVLAEE
jgi:hypothetical protein